MISTTTPTIEGRRIAECRDIVFGEVVAADKGMLMVTASGTAVVIE